MAYQLTADDIVSSLKRTGNSIPETRAVSFGDSVMQGVDKFNKTIENAGLPNLGAGILSAVPKTAVNIANFPGSVLNKVAGTHIPQLEIPDWLNPSSSKNLRHSPTQNAMGSVGEIIGDVISGGKAFKEANKLLGLSKSSPIIAKMMAGGLTGGAISNSDQPGGRALGAAAGAIIPGVAGLSKGSIGKSAAEISQKNESKYSALYNKIFNEAEKMPIKDELSIPHALKEESEGIKELYKQTDYKLNSSLKRFKNNPSLKNAHDAQRDLGIIKRNLEAQKKKGINLGSGGDLALSTAKDMQKRIRGMMQQQFVEGGRSDLASEYGKTTRGFAKEVAPLRSQAMSEYKSGAGKSKNIAKELLGNNEFKKSELASQIPGYGVRKAIHDVPGWAKTLAAGAVVPGLSMAGVPIPYYLRKILGG